MNDARKTKVELIAEIRALRERVASLAAGGSAADPTRVSSREEEGRYRHILENLRAIIVETDDQGRFTYVSPTITEVLGYAPEELLNRRGLQRIHKEDRAVVAELFQKALTSKKGTKLVYRARHKNGHWLWLETTLDTYRTADGSTYTVALAWDVTDVKRAEEALRESEALYRALAENASDLIAEVDDDGRFVFISPNCSALLGYRAEDLIGRTLRESGIIDNIHPEDREFLLKSFERDVASGGKGGQIEFRYRHADGTWRWFDSKASTYRKSDGALRAVVISREVSERVRAQRELRESEERYRVVAEASRDMITEMDMEGRLVYASPTCEQVLGYAPTELVGTMPLSLVHPEDVDPASQALVEAMENQTPSRLKPIRLRRRDGSWLWAEGTGIRYRRANGELRFLAVTRDITERRRAEQERRELEERMREAQKLESLGVLAGGVAHDFNNLLTPILGDASLALMDLPADSPMRARLQKIQRAAQRAATLTHQMLAYGGKGPLLVEPLDLSGLVQEMGQLLESAVSGKAVLTYELPADLPAIEADAAQVSQVVMNLITNASDALGDGEGRVTVRSGTVDADRVSLSQAILGDELPEGTYVYFEVVDNGCGMDAETRSRIFEPFFTTKFTGRGLGLAAVLGIVRRHRGAIEIESEPDRGTRFRVLFPSSPRPPARDRSEPAGAEEWTGSGTVLVVEDDDQVREIAEDTLKRAGLSVLCAAGGREGVELFRRHVDEIRAVLLDQTMPAMSGEGAFDAMRRIRPDAPIILVSGYSEEGAAERFAGKGLTGFLQKPFLPTTLIEKVRQVFEE